MTSWKLIPRQAGSLTHGVLDSGGEAATMVCMRSPVLALMLIASVLACPLRCLSCKVNASTRANVAASEPNIESTHSCCSHCHEVPESDSPASNAPAPSHNDCDCQACICEGAVVEADAEVPDQSLDAMPLFSWVPPPLATHALTGHDTARRIELLMRCSFASSRQLLSGRNARLAHQSWLI